MGRLSLGLRPGGGRRIAYETGDHHPRGPLANPRVDQHGRVVEPLAVGPCLDSASENEADQGEANSQRSGTEEPAERCRVRRFFASFEKEKKSSQTERDDDKCRRAHRSGGDDMLREDPKCRCSEHDSCKAVPEHRYEIGSPSFPRHAVRQEAEENLSHDLNAYLNQELEHPSLSEHSLRSLERKSPSRAVRAIAWGPGHRMGARPSIPVFILSKKQRPDPAKFHDTTGSSPSIRRGKNARKSKPDKSGNTRRAKR
jgi:hypothetical protein